MTGSSSHSGKPASDPIQAQKQRLLNLVLLGLAIPGALFGLAMLVLWLLGRVPPAGAIAGLGVQPFYALSYWLGKRGKVRLAAYIPVVAVFLAMVVGNREKLLQRLAGNEDDLYIMGQPPDQMDVVSEAFADNPLVLVAPPDHPLVGKKRIAPERLRSEPFILREPGSGTRLTSEKFFADHGITMKNRLEVGSNEAIKQTVAGGLGLAVLSAHTVTAELALGELVQLDVRGFPLIRRWHVVVPRGKRLSAAAQAFKDWLFTHR